MQGEISRKLENMGIQNQFHVRSIDTKLSSNQEKQHLPILNKDTLKQLDTYCIDILQLSATQLMEQAGYQLARLIQVLSPKQENPILILCGKGNNGGDGACAARYLKNWGFKVLIITPITEITNALTHAQLNIASKIGIPITDHFSSPNIPSVIVDGLLGYGAKGDPRSPYKELIDTVNTQPGIKVSIDSPSGLDASSGELSQTYFHATHTLSLGCLKTGFFNPKTRHSYGNLFVCDIGIPPEVYEALNHSPPSARGIAIQQVHLDTISDENLKTFL